MSIDCHWSGDLCTSIISITPATQQNEAVTFVGKPAGFISSGSGSLQISYMILNYLTPGFFTAFPDLNGLLISNYQKITFGANPNLSCAKLQKFYIYDGILLNVPEGFLQSCSLLDDLYLSRNAIETIDKNAFKGLTKLATLQLENNNLTCLPADLFQNLPLLSTLLLRHNKIKIINSGIFRNLPSIIYINLEGNQLQYLPTFNLNGTSITTQTIIVFQDNPIFAISPDFLSIFPKRSSLPDIAFNLARILCINDDGRFINLNTYMSSGPYLQKCFQNWTSSMTDNVLCGQGLVTTTTAAPPCPFASFWQQLLDYLKSLKLI